MEANASTRTGCAQSAFRSLNWARLISEKRSYIMGIATIMIVIFHGRFPHIFGTLHNVIDEFFWLGVEIFLFISGFGIHFALNKNPQQPLSSFYQKRLCRLLPTCILFGIVLLPLWVKSGRYDALTIFLTFIGLNTWYVRTQLLYYLGAPFLHAHMQKKKKAFVLLLICSFVCFALTAEGSPVDINPFFPKYSIQGTTICWTINRLPAFMMGLYVALHWNCEWGKQKSLLLALSSVCVFTVYIIARTVVNQTPEILTSDSIRLAAALCTSNDILFFAWPGVCVLIAITSLCMPIGLRKAIEWMGRHSLEIYLTHEPIFVFARMRCHFNILYFLLTSIFAIILAAILKRLVTYLVNKLILKVG